MQPRHPHRPPVRAVRREISPPRPKKRKRRRILALMRTALLLTAVVAGGWYLWQRAGESKPLPAVAVQWGTVEDALEVDGLIIRRERVVTAPQAGLVHRLAEDGERIRRGAAVVEMVEGEAPTSPASSPESEEARREYDQLSVEIYQQAAALSKARWSGEAERAAGIQSELEALVRRQTALVPRLTTTTPAQSGDSQATPSPETEGSAESIDGATKVTTDTPGIILYQVDGLEEQLDPDHADRWSPSLLRALPYANPQTTAQGLVQEGEPLFKVVEDLNLELLLVLPASRLSPAQQRAIERDGVGLLLSGREEPVTAKQEAAIQEGEDLLLRLTLPVAGSEEMGLRRIRVSLLLDQIEGWLLPRSAIDVQSGLSGVWVQVEGKPQFRPVRVLGGGREQVAVEGDLSPGIQVLKEPPPSR